jgi:hypothetical protein
MNAYVVHDVIILTSSTFDKTLFTPLSSRECEKKLHDSFPTKTCGFSLLETAPEHDRIITKTDVVF